MVNFGKATAWDKEVVLAWLLYRMDMETRQNLMNDLPQSYNRIVGRDVVKVVRAGEE